ncbi:MAG TPA: hypothetical protein EYQ12_03985, partial [Oceanospirillaceae bacterium]|nr:hypothetical protein [Oceanospirillaceae bacterium]
MFTICMKDTVRFFLTHWWKLALIVVPLNLVGELIRGAFSPTATDPLQTGSFGLYITVVILVSIIASVATIHYIDSSIKAAPLSVTQSWLLAVTKFSGYLVLSLLSFLAVATGLLVFIIPGIVVMARISLASYIYLLENRSANESIKESWALTKGHFGDLFFGTILFSIPGGVVGYMVAGSGDPMNSSLEAAVA